MKRKQQATASGEDYLEAILVIQMHKGAVRSVDIARHMEVSKPSVCHAVNSAGVDPKEAECDACRMEHAISESSFQQLKAVSAAFEESKEQTKMP